MAQQDHRLLASGGTGALGRAVVEIFLERGFGVAVPWIDKGERDVLEGLHPGPLADGRLILIEADIATAEGAARAVAAAGRPQVLVNGAGGFAAGGMVHETELDLWDAMFRINVRTAAALSAAALPGMLERRSGVIVNVASRAAVDAPAGLAAYSASKSAVAVLTRTLQNEVAGHGIRVNAVVPTTIDTPANRQAMPDADFDSWTAPADIARVIAWLASEDASTVRGALIPV